MGQRVRPPHCGGSGVSGQVQGANGGLPYLESAGRMATANLGVARFVDSDGQNYRLANLTGCPVGALMTNVGSGYTSAPTVAASAGSSAWTAVVGGAINSTVTVTTGY